MRAMGFWSWTDGPAVASNVRGNMPMRSMGHIQMAMRGFRSILFILMGA